METDHHSANKNKIRENILKSKIWLFFSVLSFADHNIEPPTSVTGAEWKRYI